MDWAAAADYTLTPETFKKHLELLESNYYHVISMQEFVGFLYGGNPVPLDAVVITFDDWYESFYRYAYPILKKHGMVVTNFMLVSYLGTNPGILFLSWDEITAMGKTAIAFILMTVYGNAKIIIVLLPLLLLLHRFKYSRQVVIGGSIVALILGGYG
ncbi:polysaccharide deacetylase family protein [Paenibacillus filicis]|uniref:Polysaccharide deacetylase family protein n=1 Tax=Paenibacillus gyeongsangnamensis TaxID=3388067 RepID=A0ABT4QDW4_9BACL|nr:polysaccharide deacetylase family protein [Paenibacillus filicis]MCZ8515039.1 polysaccharide deacetylase family protein [Paenibacillus filicis]